MSAADATLAPEGGADAALARRLGELLTSAVPGGAAPGMARRTSPYRSTHVLEEVDLDLPGEARVSLVLKASGSATTQGIRPGVVMDGHRERWAYEELLPGLRVDAPRFFGVLDPGGDGERLVLERVGGRPLHLTGDLDIWCAAAWWLGRFHRRGRTACEAAVTSGRLLVQDESLHKEWLDRALGRVAADGGDPEWTGAIRRAACSAIRVLARCPRTLVHGEFYPSNVIVELEPGPVARPGRAASDVRTPDRRGGRDYRAGAIRVVDWESIGIGPAALDLAALTAGDWSAAARARMVRAYRSSAPRPVAGRADFDLVVEAARLVNALQWLGWSDGWTAPPQHARDWRGEASSAARRVADAGLEAP